MFDFQKLEVYQLSKQFHKEIRFFLISKKLDKYYYDQLGRASLSIPINIAEGTSRFTNPGKQNFYVIARDSVFECTSILEILFEEELLSELTYHSFLEKAERISKILFTMIRNLDQSVSKGSKSLKIQQ